jgi:hypothetical protein
VVGDASLPSLRHLGHDRRRWNACHGIGLLR